MKCFCLLFSYFSCISDVLGVGERGNLLDDVKHDRISFLKARRKKLK